MPILIFFLLLHWTGKGRVICWHHRNTEFCVIGNKWIYRSRKYQKHDSVLIVLITIYSLIDTLKHDIPLLCSLSLGVMLKYAGEYCEGCDAPCRWCDADNTAGKVFRIGTMHYKWPISAHASQAFSIAYCTDSEDLPS